MNIDSFDYNKFANSLQKVRSYAAHFKYKCCCPECNEAAIKSHLLQRHPVLEALTGDKNGLLQFEDNWEDARSGRWDLYTEKTRGINDAMQYRLFCGKHDSLLFKDLESRNSIPESKRDCLLLAYRAACSVKHQEERRKYLYESKIEHDSNEFDDVWLKNSLAFIRRMDAVIDNLWEALGGADNSYIFRMIALPYIPVAASDCIVDEEDYQQHIMDDDCRIPLNCYFVNLSYLNDETLMSFAESIANNIFVFWVSSEKDFYTSDFPIVVSPHVEDVRPMYMGLAQYGGELTIPLSPENVLSVYDREYFKDMESLDGSFIKADAKEVRRQNLLRYFYASRHVFSYKNDFSLIDSYYGLYGKHKFMKPNLKAEIVSGLGRY